MSKPQILIALSAKDKKSKLINQTIFFTDDFKIFAIFSRKQLKKLTSLYELGFDNSETRNLLPTYSEKDTIEINCNQNTNPALYLMFIDLSDLYTIRAKMEKDLGNILGIEAKKTYLFNTLFPLETPFDKDIAENPVQDSEIPDNVKFNETPFCKSCDNLEPFTPTVKLNIGEFCLKCCDFSAGDDISSQRVRLAIKKMRIGLQMDYYYLKAEGLEIELSDLP